MPLTTHAGAGDPSSWSGPETVCLLSLESGGWPARRAMHFMILGGVFERHPNLRLVLTEQPGDWWTSTVDDLDSTYLASIHTPGLAEQTPRRPSEYAHENVFIGASFLARYEAEHAVRDGYTRQVMWGSDYPHMESAWPHTREKVHDLVKGIDEDDVRKIVAGNAVDCYSLDAAVLQAVADRIGPAVDEIVSV